MKRIWIGTGLMLCLSSSWGGWASAQPSDAPPSPLTLEWCIERAVLANPEIAEQGAMLAARAARVDAAGRFDDPRFAYEASNLPLGDFDFASTPMSGHQLGLKQKLPFPGLLASHKQAARAARAAATSDLADRERRIAAVVEARWAELGFAQRALDVTDRNIELVRELSKIAEAKYRVGKGLQQDVLRAQVALTRLLEDRLEREASLETASASLSAVLDLDGAAPLPRTAEIADGAALPELTPLLAELEASSPLLASARAQIEEAEREVDAARLAGYPDFDLGVGYRIRENVPGDPVDGDDFVSAGVTIRLPVDRRKWQSTLAERRAFVRRAEAGYRRSRAELRAALRSIHARLVQADREQELLANGLVPQARQSFDASRSGYEVGRVDFLSLLDSQVRLLDAELQQQRAAADRRSAFAALEATLGEAIR